LFILIISWNNVQAATTRYFTNEYHDTLGSSYRWLKDSYSGANNTYSESGNFTGEGQFSNGTSSDRWAVTLFPSNITLPAGTWNFSIYGNTSKKEWYPRLKIYNSDGNLIHTTTSPNPIDSSSYMTVSWTDSVPSFNVGSGNYYTVEVYTYRNSSGNRTDRFRIINASNFIIDTYTPVIYHALTRSWRWYDDQASLTPNVALGGEQATPTGMYNHNQVRLRETVIETDGASQTGRKRLQFSSDAVNFTDVGEIGSGAVWAYCNGGGTDDTLVPSLLLSTSNTFGPFVESGTAASSYTHSAYAAAEYDFCLQENNALVNTTYYFRMIDVVSGQVIYPDATYFWPNITISNHGLNLEIDPNFSLSTINMDDAPGPTTGSFGNMYIRDYTGAGGGWSVTATATDFSDGLGHVMTIDNLTMTSQNVAAIYAESTAGIILGGGQLSNTTPINVATAGNGNGTGNFVVDGDFSLYVPIATVPGNYTSTVTVTVS